jgi:4-amino-4-deoxy-L-arabinose transferase-like glycosyltransferase
MENSGAQDHRRKDAMPFRSPKITKPEGIAPSSAISAPAVAWRHQVHERNEPPQFDPRVFRLLLLWAILTAVFYIGSCGYPRLLDQIDGQYAGAAREMISRNDWLVPTQNSIPRLRKPPLAYWMEIVSLRSFGENEFAARLPICLATFGWFVATALLAYECTRDRLTSLASTVILATFFGTFQFSHLVMPEPVFGSLMTVSFWLLVRLAKRFPGEKLHPELLLLWTSMAAAVLCKGIHGLLLPVGVLAVASIFRRTLRPLCRRVVFCGTGWLIFLALVLPWYLAIEHRYPGFILDQLGNEQANMLVSRRWPVDGDHLTFVNFWLEQFAVLFPWTLLIPGAAVVSFRVLRVNPRLSSGALLLLLLCFLYAAAISFANLQDYYLLICFPVMAIWLAWSLRQSIPPVFSGWIPGIFLILLGASGVIVSNLQLAQMFSAGDGGRGEQPAINSVASALVNVAGATGRTLSNVLLLFGVCAIVVGLLIVLFRRRSLAPVIILPPFVLLICLLGLAAEVALQDYLSSAAIAAVIERNSDANTLIVSKGDISDRTSLYFYLHRQLHWLDGDPHQEYAARRYGIGGDLYLKKEDVVAAWNSSRQVCIVVDNHELNALAADLKVVPNAVHVLFTTPTDVVVVNREKE